MKALRRVGAIFTVLALIGASLGLAATARGWDWMLYFGVAIIAFGAMTLIVQLILFILLRRATEAWYDYFYWFTATMSFALIILLFFIVRTLLAVAAFVGGNRALFGWHLLLAVPFLIQIVLICMKEIRVRRIS